MDFLTFATKETKKGVELRPSFVVGRHKDLMVQGRSFYAVWDEEAGLWSRSEYDVVRLVDKDLMARAEAMTAEGVVVDPKPLSTFDNGGWLKFVSLCKNVSDNSHPLDSRVLFANSEIKKTDYASRRLPYAIGPGPIDAYNEMFSLLYTDEERAKFEWAIGAVIAGDAKKIQKFLVFFGPGGTGKSTVMTLIEWLFGGLVSEGGYIATFEAKALVGNNNQFSTEAFRDNPLVAIQHDGDLSSIEDNSKLNSIVSHEKMKINEKYKATYDSQINAFLFMGTNKPVKITDSRSGIIRRLIDVEPTGNLHDPERWHELSHKMTFELGAIAHHCLQKYKSMGRSYYNGYRPEKMIIKTNPFANFMDENYDLFKRQDGCSYKQGWELWKQYREDAQIEWKLPMHRFRDEFGNFFHEFHERYEVDGVMIRSYFKGFKDQQYKAVVEKPKNKPPVFSLVLEETTSIFDELYGGLKAQYGKNDETPAKYWDDSERLIRGEIRKPKPDQICSTILADLDTSKLHFVKVPENHIVIDFDLKGPDGEKSLEANLIAASEWPHTYAELSKSGNGLHLHYLYDGDTSELANVYSEGIEVKVYRGGASLRRKLTKCNNIPPATISSGLPFREKKMLDTRSAKSEQGIRNMILRNLQKEFHPATKPSMDFIEKILLDAYNSGVRYNVEDLRPKVMAFAGNSTNQAVQCLQILKRLKWASEEHADVADSPLVTPSDDRLVFFDIEVYPNLVLICWKFAGDEKVECMLNPTPQQIEWLLKKKLVGFNCRNYDNHILWAIFIGESIAEIYRRSQQIINSKNNDGKFGEAYNLSYIDVWDMNTDKQGLKKWEIQLGIPHMEMDIPWDQPVPEERWKDVADYCTNDVRATETVFEHNSSDYAARLLIARLSGLRVNDPTRRHATKIIFGNDKNPQSKFVYTDLSEEFPGYVFDEFSKDAKSTYRGEVVGEGGYVYAEPGIYENVALLDVASMHPSTIRRLNIFGPYTQKFNDLLAARLAIKHKDYEGAKRILPGLETPRNDQEAKELSTALKLVINSIYGYTAARFPNEFLDPRNKDNIVAKRGALFMIDLKHFLQERGFTVAHIKTDSVKIPNATPEIIHEVFKFGQKYGYDFEHEETYQKLCLVNDAVYVARKSNGEWTATGAEFKHPVVFKALFTDEPFTFRDLCETKSVSKGAIYLKNYGGQKEGDPQFSFVGKTGLFLPVLKNGAELVRVVTKDDGEVADYTVQGTKGYQWMEASVVETMNLNSVDRMTYEDVRDTLGESGTIWDVVDQRYYEEMIESARDTIEKFGSYQEFVK